MNGHSPYVRSKIQSIWAPSTIYKISKGTQSHEIQLKQYSLSHLVYNINSHWYVLPGRYLRRPFPTLKTLRSMLYGLVEICAVVELWLGVTVEQASKGAPVGKEMTGTAVETSSNTPYHRVNCSIRPSL